MNSYNGFTPQQRQRAQNWLNAQYKAGLRTRPTQCRACGQTKGIIHAHAEDYSEPFGDHIEGYHLCYVCHMVLHCRFGNGAAAWERYRAHVRAGWQAEPSYRPDFGRIKSVLAGGDFQWVQAPGTREPVLDTIGTPPTEAALQGRL